MRIKKQIIISIIRDKKKPKGKPSVFFLFEQLGVIAEALPVVKVKAVCVIRLNNISHDNSNRKYNGCDERPLEPHLVGSRRLLLAIVGLVTACDGTGETLVSGLLEDYSNYDENSSKQQHCQKNEFHIIFLSILSI